MQKKYVFSSNSDEKFRIWPSLLGHKKTVDVSVEKFFKKDKKT